MELGGRAARVFGLRQRPDFARGFWPGPAIGNGCLEAGYEAVLGAGGGAGLCSGEWPWTGCGDGGSALWAELEGAGEAVAAAVRARGVAVGGGRGPRQGGGHALGQLCGRGNRDPLRARSGRAVGCGPFSKCAIGPGVIKSLR